MVSVIISSANAVQLKQVIENITATIGVPHEVIAIDNSDGRKGICEVYNAGITQAKYNLLCFMHEDILIKTNNWGQVLHQTFHDNPDLGLLGVVGNSYKALAPSGWATIGPYAHYINIIQSYKHSARETELIFRNPYNEKLSKAACIDGVFMCSTKKVAGEFMFDDKTFTGFHSYDIDFSLAIGQKYKVGVTYEILINHFSEGGFDKNWMLDTIKLHKKWNHILPINYSKLSPKEVLYTEKATFKYFIKQLVSLGLPVSLAAKMLYLDNRFLRLDVKLFLKMHFYISKQLFKKKA